MHSFVKWSASALVALSLAACAKHTTSNTSRTATEQLLLTTATDRATREVSWSHFADQGVYLDSSKVESVDKQYVISSMNARLGVAGARLVSERPEASVILEPRVAALGTDLSSYLLGIPSIEIPLPPFGAFKTPELALFKKEIQEARARFALHAVEATSGSLVLNHPSAYGKAYHAYWSVFSIPFISTDIPELLTENDKPEVEELPEQSAIDKMDLGL